MYAYVISHEKVFEFRGIVKKVYRNAVGRALLGVLFLVLSSEAKFIQSHPGIPGYLGIGLTHNFSGFFLRRQAHRIPPVFLAKSSLCLVDIHFLLFFTILSFPPQKEDTKKQVFNTHTYLHSINPHLSVTPYSPVVPSSDKGDPGHNNNNNNKNKNNNNNRRMSSDNVSGVDIPDGITPDLWAAWMDLRKGCYPDLIDGVDPSYGYRPTLGAGIAFDVLFGICIIGHLIQLIRFRRWTSGLMMVGAISAYYPLFSLWLFLSSFVTALTHVM